MTIAEDILLTVLAFALFGFVHSVLASPGFKKKLLKEAGTLIAFYRLVYNLIAIFFFYLLYEILPHPDAVIYDLATPWDFIILIPQFLSIAGLIWTLKYFSSLEFLGINQVIRWFRGEYRIEDSDERLTLRIEGPYRFSRHPLYLFTILFLLFRPVMDIFYLTFFLCIVAYFYTGSFFEEKKLIETFGEKYIIYKKSVPRIFPFKISGK
ncbi:MAG TPA: methyltransferase [Ignavibacteriaceae bacterium]|nr:methyltransferase [Ignavibacteriaceae bacterium]